MGNSPSLILLQIPEALLEISQMHSFRFSWHPKQILSRVPNLSFVSLGLPWHCESYTQLLRSCTDRIAIAQRNCYLGALQHLQSPLGQLHKPFSS